VSGDPFRGRPKNESFRHVTSPETFRTPWRPSSAYALHLKRTHVAATNKTATHGVIHRPPFLFAGQISPLAAAQTHPRRTSSRGMRRAWCQCLSGSGGAVDQLCAEDALFCVDRLLGNARRHSGRALPRQLLVVRTISVVAEGAAAATSALTRWLPRKPLAPSSNALSSAMLVEVQFRHSG